MKILEDIIADLEKGVKITEIRRGLLWIGVVSRHCGLASTLYQGGCGSAGWISDNSPDHLNMVADELAALSFSQDIPEASLGMAAINSLIEFDQDECEELNASDFLLKAGHGKNVSIIGHFPFVDKVKEVANNLWVIEKRPQPGDLEEEKSSTYLPRSDVIAISSTTFINHTLPSILKLCPAGSVKIMLGPSTPMSKILFDYGIDIISGCYVTDTALVLENISRGISFSAMKRSGGIRLLNLFKDKEKYKRIMSSSH
ncbi:MAG: DUF364 domain-containing protein [Pseudomonadota bacterium]